MTLTGTVPRDLRPADGIVERLARSEREAALAGGVPSWMAGSTTGCQECFARRLKRVLERQQALMEEEAQ